MHPVTGFHLLGVGGQAIVAVRQRPVDTAVRIHVKLGQAQRQLRSADEFLDHLVAVDQQHDAAGRGFAGLKQNKVFVVVTWPGFRGPAR